jgi:hypothetical protein
MSQVKWVKEMIDPAPKLVKRSLDMFAVPLGHNEANEFGVATYGLGLSISFTFKADSVVILAVYRALHRCCTLYLKPVLGS